MSRPAGLSLDGVACLRGERLLFAGLSLTLAAGDAALVTGPNGAGKSSLLRMAAGLLPPSAGRMTRAGRVAWMGEAIALYAAAPLARALGWWAAMDGAGGEGVAEALDAMGIAALAPVPVRLLSTGQRRRAAIARVVASGAPLWLLDEPANGLDADGLARLEAALARHRAEGGIAVVATHQPVALPGATPVILGPERVR